MAHPIASPRTPQHAALYRTIWRWHFYAGLFVIPFILLLSVTGAAYLFKPQVERWEERAFYTPRIERVVLPSTQVEAALASVPGARFVSYRLPERSGDAAMVQVALPEKGLPARQMTRDIFVSPDGKVLGSLDPERRIMATLKAIHGQLLLGTRGSWLVELAASWALVLILSGLYLWWPRDRRLAGLLWPRLRKGRRLFWRDLHAVTGFWIAGLAIILLMTGLPWAGIWGSAFKAARTELGWVNGTSDWTIGGEAPRRDAHADHHPLALPLHQADLTGLDVMLIKAQAEPLAFPVLITPPGAPGPFGQPGASAWTIRSDTQNRPLRTTIRFDPTTHHEISRNSFADGHIIDRVVGYGIAWHEGQLFGWVNQFISVLTALGLMLMAASGFILWRRRKPVDVLGAPPSTRLPARMGGVAAILLLLAALLPLLALSLLMLWLVERLVLPRMPGLARWLGVVKGHA